MATPAWIASSATASSSATTSTILTLGGAGRGREAASSKRQVGQFHLPLAASVKLAASHMRILLLDNYDSFTWNLHHLLEPHAEVDVVRNDAITVDEAAVYDRIVLSPGPGLPNEAGIMMDLLARLMPTPPILGVCRGMQGIVEICGGTLFNQEKVMHGISVPCCPSDPVDP